MPAKEKGKLKGKFNFGTGLATSPSSAIAGPLNSFGELNSNNDNSAQSSTPPTTTYSFFAEPSPPSRMTLTPISAPTLRSQEPVEKKPLYRPVYDLAVGPVDSKTNEQPVTTGYAFNYVPNFANPPKSFVPAYYSAGGPVKTPSNNNNNNSGSSAAAFSFSSAPSSAIPSASLPSAVPSSTNATTPPTFTFISLSSTPNGAQSDFSFPTTTTSNGHKQASPSFQFGTSPTHVPNSSPPTTDFNFQPGPPTGSNLSQPPRVPSFSFEPTAKDGSAAFTFTPAPQPSNLQAETFASPEKKEIAGFNFNSDQSNALATAIPSTPEKKEGQFVFTFEAK
jgi:hypothetical protein